MQGDTVIGEPFFGAGKDVIIEDDGRIGAGGTGFADCIDKTEL